MKIFLDMVGCRLNQAEIEKIAGEFRAESHSIVASAAEADLVVINTCVVTAEAASDSRQKIRQAGKKGAQQILVTGCWSTLQPSLAAELPNVIKVISNEKKDRLVRDYLGLSPINRQDAFADPSTSNIAFEHEPISRERLPGLRGRTRAFIKVQDGCDNTCTFCITTIARGAGQSRGELDVLEDIQAAWLGGAKEVVLTGVHLGSWGREQNQHLKKLISTILAETEIPRIRLSSLEPWDLDADFFELWRDQRLCAHLHLPLQSGSNATLKRMLRKTSAESFQNLVESARASIPNVAISTDIIAGFPGESEKEFAETLAFVEKMKFAGGHVFTYSPRPGTAAARMRDQIPNPLRRERSHLLGAVLQKSSEEFRTSQIDQVQNVLWEGSSALSEDGWKLEGLSDNYVRVYAQSPQPRWNEIDQVKLTGLKDGGMSGIIL